MFMERIFIVYYLWVIFKFAATQDECTPVYVRWARVRLSLTARVEGPYALENCTKSCTNGNNPARPGFPLECSGFNHKQGANSLSHDCQLFQRDQLSNIDGHIEADDRYSFFWKYCAKTRKMCKSAYQFDFYIDRYMDSSEIQRTINTDKVEDCLSRCLDETSFTCRSISFNRTASVCSLSSQSQISKPGYLRVNNNPNYRIDYYENNCFNGKVDFYGKSLYRHGIFTCNNVKENNNVLDIVLSTDGLEPLYFLTDQDLLYQAKCPVNSFNILPAPSTIGATVVFVAPQITTPTTSATTETTTPSSTSFSSTSSTTSSTLVSDSLSTFSETLPTTEKKETTVVSEKKPLETLPVVDFTPKVDKIDTDDSFVPSKGNKITVVVKYDAKSNEKFSSQSSSKTEPFSTKSDSTFSSTPTSSTTETTSTTSTTTTTTSSSSTTTSTTTTTAPTTTETSTSTTTTSTTPTTTSTSSTTTEATPTTTSTTSTTTTSTTPTLTSPKATTTTTTLATKRIATEFEEAFTFINPRVIIANNIATEFSKGFAKSTTSEAQSVVLSSTPFSSTNLSESSTATSRKIYNPIYPRSTSSSSSTTTKFWEIPKFTSATSTTTEPPTTTSTTSRSTSDSILQATERPFFSRFDPFGSDRQWANSLPGLTTSTTTIATKTSQQTTNRPTVESNFDARSSTQITSSKPKTSTDVSTTTIATVTNAPNATVTLPSTTTAPQKILFDIFHNGQPVSAVVVGSRISLAFSSGLGIPAPYVNLIHCRVEPVNSPYAWEREPLHIVKNGCQADGVGLVCPPARTDFGVKVEMEAFRYTQTSEVLYSCLLRVCVFNQCPQPFCNAVEGCDTSASSVPVLTNFRGRRKRQQLSVPFIPLGAPSFQIPGAFQQNLLGSAGDIVVTKKLVVVNSENELQYYLRTGNVPTGGSFNTFVGR